MLKKLLIAAVLILLIGFALLKNSPKSSINLTEVVVNASRTDVVSSFLDGGGKLENITVIFPDELKKLSKEQPVIYSGLPNRTLYKLVYSSGERGLLIIFDGEKVLRQFNVINVRI